MKDLIDTTEMYLKTIVELEEQGIRPLRARIAERLEHSGPTVSQTVARMERDELLIVDSDRSLELTESGRELATSVMRKHRLEELGLEPETGPQARALTDVATTDKDLTVKIQWLGEPLQVDTFLLGQFKRTGVVPDAVASLRVNGEYLTLTVEGEPEVLDLPPETADNVFVTVE